MEKEIAQVMEPFLTGKLFDEEVSQRLFCRQGQDVVLEAACIDENGVHEINVFRSYLDY